MNTSVVFWEMFAKFLRI